jgi:hypothetical protein
MKRLFLALPALLTSLAGCEPDTPSWQQPPDLLSKGPSAEQQVAWPLADRVAFIDKRSATAFILDPADASLSPRMVPVGKAPIAAEKHKTSNKLLVLSQGDLGSVDTPPTPAELDVIDANATVPVERHVLDGRFDSMAQSEDGRFVVLYHRADQSSRIDSTLYNPNDLYIVDFALARETGKSIRSLGSVPSDIVFSPPLGPLGGRRLAAVLSPSYVTLFDLDNPERTEISVFLCRESTGCAVNPKQILFDAENLRIFVRAEGTSDIFKIELQATEPDPPHNDFHVENRMLAVGGIPTDMVLYQHAAGIRLAVAAPGVGLAVIDPGSSDTVVLPTLIPINRIVPFADAMGASHALLLDTQRGSTSVHFATLSSVESSGALAIKADDAIGIAVGNVIPLLDQGMVVLMGSSKSGGTAITVVDLAAQSFKQIGSGSALVNATVETRAPSRLWGVTFSTLLSYMNLSPRPNEPLGTGETWLDQPIIGIDPLVEPSADGHRYLVVGHPDPNRFGNVTFLDADNPDRALARTAYGFLLTDYLEREQP